MKIIKYYIKKYKLTKQLKKIDKRITQSKNKKSNRVDFRKINQLEKQHRYVRLQLRCLKI